MLTAGSLFSGIGGLDLGLERAGWTIKWQVEVDEWCRKVLTKHWPDVPRYGDIRELKGDELEPVDLICGGFPCQPFSVAGKRRGAADDRYLWPEMFRIIKALRPAWVLGENVANIVNMALDTVLSDLESEGYEAATFVIPACAVGAPHRRDRVWIVAYSHGKQADKQLLESKQPSKQRWVSLETGQEASRQEDGQASNNNLTRLRKNVAHTAGIRRQGLCEVSGGLEAQQEERRLCQSQGGRALAYPQRDRLQGIFGDGAATDLRRRFANEGGEDGSGWEPQPGLGRVLDGPADWLDGHRWPAPFGCEQYDWEPPRLASGIPNRVARLRALGNAVVPAVVKWIGQRIIASLEARHEPL